MTISNPGDPRARRAPMETPAAGTTPGAGAADGESLGVALQGARTAFAAILPPAWLEPRVLAAMARAQPRAQPQPARAGPAGVPPGAARAWPWPAAALASVVVLLSVALAVMPRPAPPEAPLAGAGPASGPSEFVAVAGAEMLRASDAATIPAWIVTTEMPRERLGALGLPYDPARAGESVRAELLMHGSGTVLAVRLVAR